MNEKNQNHILINENIKEEYNSKKEMEIKLNSKIFSLENQIDLLNRVNLYYLIY